MIISWNWLYPVVWLVSGLLVLYVAVRVVMVAIKDGSDSGKEKK